MLALAWITTGVAPAWAQFARVGGKVTDNDVPQPGVQVIYKSKNNGRTFKFKTNTKGEFTAIGVPLDTYAVSVVDTKGKTVWTQDTVPVGVAGDNDMNSLVIDLTKGATANSASSAGGAVASGGTSGTETFRGGNNGGVKTGTTSSAKMSKEEYEKLKAEREKALNINAIIKQANDAMAQKNWQAAEAPLQQLTTAEPNNYQFQKGLGDAQYNMGKYDAAVESYKKGVEVAENMKPDPKNPASDPIKVKTALSEMLTQEGNAYLKLNKSTDATDAFKKAAAASPSGPAAFNLCVVNYNSGNAQEGIPACNQAIAADPNNAMPYFLKGSLMMQQSKQGKDGKLEAPDGTAEALNKYLELDPDGPHANDAKQMLQFIGAKIETTYKAGKKKK